MCSCIQLKMKKSLVLRRDGIVQSSETCRNISVQTTRFAFARAPSSHQHVYDTLYNRRENNVEVKAKFKIGDRVRILKKKKTFEKGSTLLAHRECCESDKIYHQQY